MTTVAMALFPCIMMAFYNTGFQSLTALKGIGIDTVTGWRGSFFIVLASW